ncbi:MAG TPA: hypothetical protein DHW82_12045 [Spirochaetia bacterium]|nr:MAG: hypothetical protein A2Y41_05860 [Spirochaetes bacterium GWB1_36_13]HCL57722.1 hypothetical protein [Spirochaetia bacterium]
MKKTVFILFALSFFPVLSYANSFSGLGIIVAGMFGGIPSAVILIGLIIASLIIGSSENISLSTKATYQTIAKIASVVSLFIFPVVMFFFGWVKKKEVGFFFFLWLPIIILSAISFYLAARI